jgi:hypothetical protein
MHKNADAFADLYAENTVHEFRLFSLFFPQRLNGREEIGRHYRTVWGASPMRILEIRDIAVHQTHEVGCCCCQLSTRSSVGRLQL